MGHHCVDFLREEMTRLDSRRGTPSPQVGYGVLIRQTSPSLTQGKANRQVFDAVFQEVIYSLLFKHSVLKGDEDTNASSPTCGEPS